MNIVMPIKVIMPEEEAAKLVPNGSELTVVICDKCFVLVPLPMLALHISEAHDA
jgi:hypothetical protein